MLNKAPQKGFVYQHLSARVCKVFLPVITPLEEARRSEMISAYNLMNTLTGSPGQNTPGATDTATADPQLLFIYFSNHCSKLELSATKAEHIP